RDLRVSSRMPFSLNRFTRYDDQQLAAVLTLILPVLLCPIGCVYFNEEIMIFGIGAQVGAVSRQGPGTPIHDGAVEAAAEGWCHQEPAVVRRAPLAQAPAPRPSGSGGSRGAVQRVVRRSGPSRCRAASNNCGFWKRRRSGSDGATGAASGERGPFRW